VTQPIEIDCDGMDAPGPESRELDVCGPVYDPL
jgi:hypothetical protein